MIRILIKNWWLLALRAAFALLFAVLAFSLRSTADSFLIGEFAMANLVVIFGLLAFVAGLCTMAAAVWDSEPDKWWLLFLDGLGICAAGVLAIMAKSMTLTALIHIIVGWAIVMGFLEVAIALKVRRHIPDEWLLLLAGLASIGFGLGFILAWSGEMRAAFTWLGAYAAFSASCMAGLALRLRSLRTSIHHLGKTEDPG